MMKSIIVLYLGLCWIGPMMSQADDSLRVTISSKMESQELKDYYRFARIDYFKMSIEGEAIADKFYLITADHYWDNKLSKVDTLINSKVYRRKNKVAKLNFSIISQRVAEDSMEIQFNLPRGSLRKKIKTTHSNAYALKNLATGKFTTFSATAKVPVLVYTLPYVDPDRPNVRRYCKLTRDGLPPEKWGEEFKIKHYIVFRIEMIE